MPTKYATCPICRTPCLRLDVWPDYNNMLICTCDHRNCKLSGFTITPDVYTDPDQLAPYGLTPADVDPAAVRGLLKNPSHHPRQHLYNSAD